MNESHTGALLAISYLGFLMIDFLSEDYVDMPLLEKMAKDIEARTGKKLKDYD